MPNRRLFARLLALVLVLALTPGLVEAVENVWHLAQNGHSAHATGESSDHQPTDEEHGCSGTFHMCSCHHASSTMPGTPSPQALSQVETHPAPTPSLPSAPMLSGLLRPPQS